MLSEEKIAEICKQELENARGSNYDDLAANREKALKYFFNDTRGDELPGRSRVQSSDVSDMVEAVLSQIGPILTNETLIQFEANGEEDEPQAQLESDFCAYMLGGQNQGFVEITSAIKDALLLKNGFIKVWVSEESGKRRYTRKGIAEFEIEAELERSNNDLTIEVADIERAGDVFDVKFVEHTHRRKLQVRALAPETIVYTPEHDSPLIDEIKFIGERKILTQSELLKMGYPRKVVAELPSVDADTNAATRARDSRNVRNYNHPDESQRMIETFDCTIEIDIEETGIGELWHIHFSHDKVLMRERVKWVGYATGSPFIIPHRLAGQSLFDKLKQTQDSKTDFLRQWHDNARAVNGVRMAYDPDVTEEDDILTYRPGAGVRSKDPQSAANSQLRVDDLGASIVRALDYQDKQRSERGGASLDLGAAQMQLAGQVGDMGAERQISIREQLAANMAATLAHTLIKNTVILIHRTLREFMPGELQAKLNGKWQRTDPSQWPERNNVVVMLGLSQGEKNFRMLALRQVIGMQVQLMESGGEGELVDKGALYSALMDWCRAATLENPDQYFIDPSSEQAQQAIAGKQQQAQQQQEMQQMMMQFGARLEEQKQQLQKYEHDTDLLLKWATERLHSEIEEAKIVGKATIELEQQQRQFESMRPGNGAAQ